MPFSGQLYARAASAPPVPRGLPLVIALTGFTDAGSAVSQLVDYFRDELDPTPLAVFSNDVLLDYRARRPVISFEQDHLTDYRPPRLELSLVHDSLGQPFLLLAGYEPDFAWDAFTAAVLEFVDVLEVSTVTWVHAIPMPVPHTRPIGTTVSGTRTELTEAHSVWQPHTQVPSTAGHLLEYRLAEAGVEVVGLRAARAALPRRHRVPGGRAGGARQPHRRDRAGVRGRRPPRGEPRVPREGRRAGRGQRRALAHGRRGSRSATTPTWPARRSRRR